MTDLSVEQVQGIVENIFKSLGPQGETIMRQLMLNAQREMADNPELKEVVGKILNTDKIQGSVFDRLLELSHEGHDREVHN